MPELVIKRIDDSDHTLLGYYFRKENQYYHLNGDLLFKPNELSLSEDHVSFKFFQLSHVCSSLPLLVCLRYQFNDEFVFCLFSNDGQDEESGKSIISFITINQPEHALKKYLIHEYCFISPSENESFKYDFSYEIVNQLDNLLHNRLCLGKMKNIVLRPKILSHECC